MDWIEGIVIFFIGCAIFVWFSNRSDKKNESSDLKEARKAADLFKKGHTLIEVSAITGKSEGDVLNDLDYYTKNSRYFGSDYKQIRDRVFAIRNSDLEKINKDPRYRIKLERERVKAKDKAERRRVKDELSSKKKELRELDKAININKKEIEVERLKYPEAYLQMQATIELQQSIAEQKEAQIKLQDEIAKLERVSN